MTCGKLRLYPQDLPRAILFTVNEKNYNLVKNNKGQNEERATALYLSSVIFFNFNLFAYG